MGARKETRRMHRLRDDFKAECAARNDPCWLCEQRTIDYAAAGDDFANDDRFQLDHAFTVRDFAELQEDVENFRASHASCNRARGAGHPPANLGTLSREWA